MEAQLWEGPFRQAYGGHSSLRSREMCRTSESLQGHRNLLWALPSRVSLLFSLLPFHNSVTHGPPPDPMPRGNYCKVSLLLSAQYSRNFSS